ncbi:3-methylitaconate isomerase [Pigmentiphaga humi]|uniref:3-methylitaconate isomerase n=1 Tax=Pigmentiphaga humi TaxID=2478468 RepID=A0A3P4B556_9BURK|nr:PrpF domain-containing protein [Pigmentiphaga humi]VCU70666.1 3-methylitaconate isomerase [Pigmentiphaga humi]
MSSHSANQASGHADAAWWKRIRRRGDQIGIPCVFMRAGTSRGAFLREEDLPADPGLREKLILAIYGSPDFRQIDGLGGATSLTSKVAIIGPPTRPDADVDYTFGQVRIDEARVDFKGNCGNISSGIGPFAIEEGLVPAAGPVTAVRIHLTNSRALLVAEVPVADGICPVQGDARVAGVPGSGAPIVLDWADVGGTLGRGLLPTGRVRECLSTATGEIEVSIVDAGNVTAFVRPSDLGFRAPEFPTQRFDADALARIEAVRDAAALRLGMIEPGQRAADVTPTIPKLYMVDAPYDYVDANGRSVAASDYDLLGRGMSMGTPHAAYAGTVAVCTGAAALIDGTLVNEVARPPGRRGGRLRIGHPMGILDIDARVGQAGSAPILERAAVVRTARRIMEGIVYVPMNRLS